MSLVCFTNTFYLNFLISFNFEIIFFSLFWLCVYRSLNIFKNINFSFSEHVGDYPGRAPSVTTLSASSIISSQAETESKLKRIHS